MNTTEYDSIFTPESQAVMDITLVTKARVHLLCFLEILEIGGRMAVAVQGGLGLDIADHRHSADPAPFPFI